MAKRSAKVSIAGMVLPVRLWTQRFAFLGLVLLSLTLMLFSRAELSSVSQVRLAIVDLVTPVIFVFSKPVQAMGGLVSNVERLYFLNQENQNLRENNARLIQWVEEARKLNIENATLRAQLEYVPDKRSQFVTARIVADTGGAYFHSLLINAGARQFVRRGQAVVWQGALIGRIAEVGNRTSRVLLMIDINSHIPVMVESTSDRAILAGNNTSRPVLEFLPDNSPISRGDRIVTSGHGGVYPPGLLVGTVAQATDGTVRVKPFVDWSKLNQAVVLDYGLDGILPPPERVPTSALQTQISSDLKTKQ